MFKHTLKQLRNQKKMTQAELGKIFHVSQQTIGAWENGRAFPDEETFNNIANYFNVTTDYLYGRNTSIPDWATTEDIIELEKVLSNEVSMSFDGQELTATEQQRVKDILTTLFWERLEEKKKSQDN